MSRDWLSHAACTSADVEQFFPTVEAGPEYEAQVAGAKAVCGSCAVRSQCLDDALTRLPYRIAGGLTPEERRGLRRAPRASERSSVLDAGLRADASRPQVRAAGLVLLGTGRPVGEVARRCGVSTRTVARWISHQRAEESRRGHRAPLLISHTHSTQAGKPTQEGHRS